MEVGNGVRWPVLAKDDVHADESIQIEDREGFVRASDLATAKAERDEAWAAVDAERRTWQALKERADRAEDSLQTARERIERMEKALGSAGEFVAVLVVAMRESNDAEHAAQIEREVLNPIQRALGAHVSTPPAPKEGDG